MATKEMPIEVKIDGHNAGFTICEDEWKITITINKVKYGKIEVDMGEAKTVTKTKTLKRGSYKNWTTKEINKVKELAKNGKSLGQIARKLKTSPGSIKYITDKHNIDVKKIYRKWTPYEEDKLLNMIERGYSHKAIARELDRTVKAIDDRITNIRNRYAK